MYIHHSVIGNAKTKETHVASCGCLKLMNKKNMIEFSSLQEAMNMGFDTCGHCLESQRAAPSREPARREESRNQFCVYLDGKDYCSSVISDRPRSEIITLRAKMVSGDEPPDLEGKEIKFTILPDGVTEDVIATEATNPEGIAQTTFDPINLPQGSTEFRAYFPDGSRSVMYIEFLPSIRNARISPRKFESATNIIFDLLEDSKINISIYKNTNFASRFSHRKTIRSYADGIMKKGNGIKVRWDGTNHRNMPVMRGTYVARLETPKDFVYHDEKGNVLSMTKTKWLTSPSPSPESPAETLNQFCVHLNGRDYCGQVLSGQPRDKILTLRAKIIPVGDNPPPLEGLTVKFTHLPDGVREEVIATAVTNQQGVAEIRYDPAGLSQGVTEFRAYFPDGARVLMYIEFLPSIRNARVSPKSFKKSTHIIFDLLEDSEINISIYKNTNFSGWASHRKTIRSYADGVMKKGRGIKVKWDGTNDNNRPTWRGTYVARLETPKDFIYHDGKGNVLLMNKTTGKLR